MGTKRCSSCNVEKPVGAFSRDRTKKDGLQCLCKECKREYWQANREKILERKRAYQASRWAALSDAERVARKSVDAATNRSPLDTATLFGGSTYTEAVAFTIPFAEERLRLEATTGVPHHIDHIKPICEGGLHVPENLQVLTGADNLSKGPVWFNEDLTDEDIDLLDQEALSFNPERNAA